MQTSLCFYHQSKVFALRFQLKKYLMSSIAIRGIQKAGADLHLKYECRLIPEKDLTGTADIFAAAADNQMQNCKLSYQANRLKQKYIRLFRKCRNLLLLIL